MENEANPCTHTEDLKKLHALYPDPAAAFAAIWEVNQQMEDLCFYSALYHITQYVAMFNNAVWSLDWYVWDTTFIFSLINTYLWQ